MQTPRAAKALLALTLMPAAAMAQGLGIGDLPKLADARAARQRPLQEKALEPFWGDLALDYGSNREYLDQQIEKVATLGDAVVPLLLEKLRPTDSEQSRNTANNCARVLRRLDPGSFVDALMDLLDGDSGTAKQLSLRLLGHSKAPRAARAIQRALPGFEDSGKREAIYALTRLNHTAASKDVAGFLDGGERRVREAALHYLRTVAPTDVKDVVLVALAKETEVALYPAFIEYLSKAAEDYAPAADALLPLLEGNKLDRTDGRNLIIALGKVAPKGHDATSDALYAVLENETGATGRAAALALLELGDKRGVSKLKDKLDESLRRNRRSSGLYMSRGHLFFALKNYGKAMKDYERAAALGRSERRTEAHLRMARCEANLGTQRYQRVLKRLRDAGATPDEIREAANEDPALRKYLTTSEPILRWFNQLTAKAKGS